MLKKLVASLVMGAFLATTGVVSGVEAATISNGVSCTKPGASTTVKVRSMSKAYVCTGNPSQTGVKGLEWTLKTCLSYWTAAKNSQDSISQQRSLVQSMSEPDRTNYNKQLDGSQAQLDKVKAVIVSNHCKKGL